MILRPDDPNERFRSELPSLPRERRPLGWRAGLQLEERGLGLLVMMLGVFGLWVVYGISTGALPAGLPPPPPPPGILIQPPVPNATQCLVPLLGIGSVGLIIVGFRRMIDP